MENLERLNIVENFERLHILWCHAFAAQTIRDWTKHFGKDVAQKMVGETRWEDPPQHDAFLTAWGV